MAKRKRIIRTAKVSVFGKYKEQRDNMVNLLSRQYDVSKDVVIKMINKAGNNNLEEIEQLIRIHK